MIKKVSALTIQDFLYHPIWSWAEEDDESVVESLPVGPFIPEDHDAVFLLADFKLRDTTSLKGTLSIRLSDAKIYLLSVPNPSGGFVDISVGRSVHSQSDPIRLAEFLNKSADETYPISYVTQFRFPNGKPIKGSFILAKNGVLRNQNDDAI